MGQKVFSSADASDLAIDVHLGVFDILKARTHAATIPSLACVKRHFFFYFPFCCRGKFLAICFLRWCFIVDRNELKYFLERSLQSTFISVIVIHRNVHLYLYIITVFIRLTALGAY